MGGGLLSAAASSSSTDVLAALVTAIGSLVVAVMTAALSYRATKRSNAQVAALTERQAERDAQRDYVYEARKRLYTDLQPIFFQLADLSASADMHISAIARTGRQGHLGTGPESWVHTDEYYILSTVHRLLVPLVLYRSCQRRLTSLDLTVEPALREQYRYARALYAVWNAGFNLAQAAPPIAYDPHNDAAAQLAQTEPAVYGLQHLYAGQVDRIVGALTIADGHPATPRPLTYAEFEDAHNAAGGSMAARIAPAVALIRDFAPATSPVLWRMLLGQAHLHRALVRSVDAGTDGFISPLEAIPTAEWEQFDWREPGSPLSYEEAVAAPMQAVRGYLEGALAHR